jgi:hypothetical protein
MAASGAYCFCPVAAFSRGGDVSSSSAWTDGHNKISRKAVINGRTFASIRHNLEHFIMLIPDLVPMNSALLQMA